MAMAEGALTEMVAPTAPVAVLTGFMVPSV
jgi:hypothetical protein